MNSFQEFSDAQRGKSWSEIISHAFEMYKGVFLYGILAMVLYTVASMVVQPISGFDSQGFSQEILEADGDFSGVDIWGYPGFSFYYGLSALVSFLLVPLFVGIIYLANQYYYKQRLHVGDLFIGYRQNFINILIYSVISSIITVIAFAMCILPGFFILPFLLLGYPILLFENASFSEALSKSFRIAKENYGVMLITTVLAIIISISGILLCGIGIFATLPFYMVMMYSAYCAFCGSPRPVHLVE